MRDLLAYALFYGVPILLIAGAVALVVWNRLRPVRLPEARCAGCGYAMRGLVPEVVGADGIVCPECGRTHTDAEALVARRRRWVKPVAALLLVAGVLGSRGLGVARDGAWGLVPMDVRVVLVRVMGPEGVSARLLDSVSWQNLSNHGMRRSRTYSRWQTWQLLSADPGWITRSSAWLADVPLRADFPYRPWQPRVYSKSERPRRMMGDYASYENYWYDASTRVATERDGQQLVVADVYTSLADETEMRLTQRVPLVDRLDQIKTPIGPTESRRALDELAISTMNTGGGYAGLAIRGVATGLPGRTVAGLRVQVIDGGTTIAEARWNWVTDASMSNFSLIVGFTAPGEMPDGVSPARWSTDPRLLEWLADPDDRFSVRVTTDPEMVLCDLDATHYLDVDVTLPGSALRRRQQLPSVNGITRDR